MRVSANKTWHLNTGVEVGIERLVLVVIIIVPFNMLNFSDERKKALSHKCLTLLRLLL